jgi:hypothetical protein
MDVVTVSGGDVIVFSEAGFDDACVYGGRRGGGDEIGREVWLVQSSVAGSLSTNGQEGNLQV